MTVYWGSGWGHTLEENLRWTNENYAYGLNLYNRHGVLLSTMGGWYEWVPPAVHFRQPYWENWRCFTDHIRRLSFIMSQGKHVADVALLYPITTIHANLSGGGQFGAAADDSANTAYAIARSIYNNNIDLDFIDFDSLQRARVEDRKLKVSGLEFQAILLPPLTTIRIKTLEKIKEFWDEGGVVVSFRRLPDASAEHGRNDPEVRALLQEIFGLDSTEAHLHPCDHRCTAYRMAENKNDRGGLAIFVPSEATRQYNTLAEVISSAIVQDVLVSEPDVYHTHQRTDESDIYFLFNNQDKKRLIEVMFQAKGQPELWDTFSGKISNIHRFEVIEDEPPGSIYFGDYANRMPKKTECSGGTKVRLPMEPFQGSVVMFNHHASQEPAVVEDNIADIIEAKQDKEGITVRGYSKKAGKKRVKARYKGITYIADARVEPPHSELILDGPWGFRLEPTMDNRWGDFRYPAEPRLIGPEARRVKYMLEKSDSGLDLGWTKIDFRDSAWPDYTYTHGPFLWHSGPVTNERDSRRILEEGLRGEIDGSYWNWYSYSQKFGSSDKDVQTSLGGRGLFGVVQDFIVLEATGNTEDVDHYFFTYLNSDRDQKLKLDFGGEKVFSREAWINGTKVLSVPEKPEGKAEIEVTLHSGSNPVLLKITQPEGRKFWTYAVVYDAAKPPKEERYVPRLKWFRDSSGVGYDIFSEESSRIGWYRFEAPPGARSMIVRIKARELKAWVNGESAEIDGDVVTWPAETEGVSQVALRVEHEPGYYAGAALEEPFAFSCDEGSIALGDWCDFALESYSGAAVYTKRVKISAEMLDHRSLLDLGEVNTTAEVHVNTKPAGLRMARPYTFDLSSLLHVGENTIEVRVRNTLANHYNIDYPTNFVYAGQTVSGLLGPVALGFMREVELRLDPVDV